MAKRRHSYAWALLVETEVPELVAPLSPEGREGLDYALELAENARERSREALHGDPPFQITPAWLAERDGRSETTVRRRIAQARDELFGTLSDSAIYHRRARAREHAAREPRRCRAPDCDNPLPERSTSRRAYCHPRCRRRHFAQRGREPG